MGKQILVAGGAGFIGSNLCEALLKADHKVICLDNLVTGDKKNIEKLTDNPNFQFIKTDTRDILIDKLPFEGTVEQIYDLASPASVTYVTKHPIEAATANSIGTKNLLDIARMVNATLLFASSSEVYGDPAVHPQVESYWGNVNPIGVRSGYDEGKRIGETLTMAYQREYDLDVKIARIFNTYGPNSSPLDSRVIPRFITQALRGEPITVHGNGKQTRSFCYVSDLVEGLIALMGSAHPTPVNLGNPKEMEIIAVARQIIELSGSRSKVVLIERPQDDPRRRRPDISLAGSLLNWNPHVTFQEGLVKTLSYFQSIL